MFNTPDYLQGLLGEAGVKQAKDDAISMGLLGAFGQLLAASGPQMRPIGGGQAIGQALLGGLGGYQGAMDKAVQDKITGLKVQSMITDAKEKENLAAILQDPNTFANGGLTKDGLTRMAMLAPNASAPYLASLKNAKELTSNKPTGQPFEVTDATSNKPLMVQQLEDGTIRTLDGFGPKRDIVLQDLGGKVIAVDKNTLPANQTFNKTMTPGESASNSVAWFNATKPTFHETDAGFVGLGTDKSGNTTVSVPTQGGQPIIGKSAKPTEDQGKSAGFFMRMLDATKTINSPVTDKDGKPLTDKNGKPLTVADLAEKPEILPSMSRTLLPDMFGGQALGNTMESGVRQKYRQAQENWVSANLRAESGAAIGKEEMDKDVRKYFPQIGDGDAVIAQKNDARRVAEQAMALRAGPLAKQAMMGNQGQQQQPGAILGAPSLQDLQAQAARLLADRLKNSTQP